MPSGERYMKSGALSWIQAVLADAVAAAGTVLP